MPYNIILSNGDVLIAGGLLDNTADSSNTSLVLVGKNYKGYGLFLNQNFVRLMENFAKSTAPTAPLPGQIWFNSTTKRLNVNISATKGTLDANWKNLAGLTISATTPTTQFTGELWYDSTNGQLYIYTGAVWRLIGPLNKLSTGNTGAIPDVVSDAPPSTTYIILKFILNDIIVGIWSNNADFNSDIAGFPVIRRGINLNSSISQKFYGNATVAESILVGSIPVLASSFLRNDQSGSVLGALSLLSDNGLSVGAASDFVANVNSGTVTLRNQTNNRDLIFSVRSSGTQTPFLRGNNVTGLAEVYNNPTAGSPALTVATKNYVDILSGSINGTANFFGNITPSANLTYTLGNTTNQFTNIFSQSILVGNVNAANTFAATSNVAQIYIGADITPTANISSNLGNTSRRFNTLHSNSASLTGNLLVGVSATIGNDLSVGNDVAIGGRISVVANVSTAGNILSSAATVSVSPTTGALVVSGGAGIAGNLNVGGNVQVSGRLIALTVPPGTANTHVATTAFVTNAVGTLGTMATQNNTAVAISGGTITGAAISSLSITNLLTPLAINSGGTGLANVGAAGTVLTSTGSGAAWQAPASQASQIVAYGDVTRTGGAIVPPFPNFSFSGSLPASVQGQGLTVGDITFTGFNGVGPWGTGSLQINYLQQITFVTPRPNTNYTVDAQSAFNISTGTNGLLNIFPLGIRILNKTVNGFQIQYSAENRSFGVGDHPVVRIQVVAQN